MATPHKRGNTIELPPWKKGWHQLGLGMCVFPLFAVPHPQAYLDSRSEGKPRGVAPHKVRPHWGHRTFEGRAHSRAKLVPPPFPCRYILCTYSMLY